MNSSGRKVKSLSLYEVVQLADTQSDTRIDMDKLKSSLKGIEMFLQDDGVLVKLKGNEYLIPSGTFKLAQLYPFEAVK